MRHSQLHGSTKYTTDGKNPLLTNSVSINYGILSIIHSLFVYLFLRTKKAFFHIDCKKQTDAVLSFVSIKPENTITNIFFVHRCGFAKLFFFKVVHNIIYNYQRSILIHVTRSRGMSHMAAIFNFDFSM